MGKDARIYLRIDADLKQQMQEYCRDNGTTISNVSTRFFVRLLAEDKRKKEAEEGVDQI